MVCHCHISECVACQENRCEPCSGCSKEHVLFGFYAHITAKRVSHSILSTWVMSILAAHPDAGSMCLNHECCLSGEMYFHLITPLAVGAVALAMLTVSLGRNEYAAFVGLMLAATSQASNPLEWGYPATYLHGPALTSGWAVANCISAYGGVAFTTLQHG